MNHLLPLVGILAMAPPQGGDQTGGGGLLGSPLILIVAIALMFYFILYLPEKRRKQEREKMLKSLERGDEVITTGGIFGKVVALADNVVTLEIAPNVKIKIGLQYVANVPAKEKTGKEAKEKSGEEKK